MRVTIASQTHTDWSLDPSIPVEIRVFALQPYAGADGTPVSASPVSPNNRSRVNWSVGGPCAVTAPLAGSPADAPAAIVIPSIVVESTTDAVIGSTATLSAYLFRTDTGAVIGPYSVFSSFFVPATSAMLTWAQIASAQAAGVIPGVTVIGALSSLTVQNNASIGGTLTVAGAVLDSTGNPITAGALAAATNAGTAAAAAQTTATNAGAAAAAAQITATNAGTAAAAAQTTATTASSAAAAAQTTATAASAAAAGAQSTANAAQTAATAAQATASAALPKAGGTLTGSLYLSGAPTGTLQATTKAYVDAADTSNASAAAAAQTTASAAQAAAAAAQATASSALPLSGGTLSGNLVLAAAPATTLQAATKGYVDAGDSVTATSAAGAQAAAVAAQATASSAQSTALAALARSGGTMTGSLILSGTPTLTLHATTKSYVDASDAANASAAATAQSAAATAQATAASAGTAAANAQSTATASGSAAAAAQSTANAAQTAAIAAQATASAALPQSGGTLTGPLTLNGPPTGTLQAATKAYVDAAATTNASAAAAAQSAAAVAQGAASAAQATASAALPKSGGTLTGMVVASSDSPTGSQLASANYVNAQISAIPPQTAQTSVRTFAGIPAGAVNGSNKSFALPHPPAAGGLFLVIVRGLVQSPDDGDYTTTSTQLSMSYSLQPGDSIRVVYAY